MSPPGGLPPSSRTPAEAEIWRWLESAAAEAARAREAITSFRRMHQLLDLYVGRHYPESMPSFRPPVVINELRTLILAEASDLVDAEPRIYVMKDPRRGGRDVQAERALRAVWARERVDLKLISAVVWACAVGTGFLRVTWDPDRNRGQGDVAVEDLDPRVVLPDPDAPDETSAQFLIYETRVDLQDIRRLFPIRGALVSDQPVEALGWRGEGSFPSPTTSSATDSYLISGPMSPDVSPASDAAAYRKRRVRVLEAYVRDSSIDTVVEPLKGPDGEFIRDERGEIQYQTTRRLKYGPHGVRRIVGANGVILFDGPNPNPGGDHGLVRIVLEPTLGQFWGQGFIQQTGELQLAADKLASAVVENAIRLNNGIIVVRGSTGIDWETFAGLPGQIVQLQLGGDFQIQYPPPMPPDMVQAPWRMLDLQRRVLGFSDPRMGVGGKGNVSPELTETEISQAQGPTRLRARFLSAAVQRLAELIFARMAAFYTTPRVIPAVEGEHFEPTVWQPLEDAEAYTVYVDPASFQLMSRSLLRRLSLALYRLGAIDRRSVLEALGWPDWELVASRLDEMERAMAAAKLAERKRR